jgi:hypothetical protein
MNVTDYNFITTEQLFFAVYCKVQNRLQERRKLETARNLPLSQPNTQDWRPTAARRCAVRSQPVRHYTIPARSRNANCAKWHILSAMLCLCSNNNTVTSIVRSTSVRGQKGATNSCNVRNYSNCLHGGRTALCGSVWPAVTAPWTSIRIQYRELPYNMRRAGNLSCHCNHRLSLESASCCCVLVRTTAFIARQANGDGKETGSQKCLN